MSVEDYERKYQKTLISIGSVNTIVAICDGCSSEVLNIVNEKSVFNTSLSYQNEQPQLGCSDRLDGSSVFFFRSMIRKPYRTECDFYKYLLPKSRLINCNQLIGYHLDTLSSNLAVPAVISDFFQALETVLCRSKGSLGDILIASPTEFSEIERSTFESSVSMVNAMSHAIYVSEPLMIAKSLYTSIPRKNYLVVDIGGTHASFSIISGGPEPKEERTISKMEFSCYSLYNSLFDLLIKECNVSFSNSEDSTIMCRLYAYLEEKMIEFAKSGSVIFDPQKVVGVKSTKGYELTEETVYQIANGYITDFKAFVTEFLTSNQSLSIYSVILAGGGGNFSFIKDILREVTGKDVRSIENPQEAVIRGMINEYSCSSPLSSDGEDGAPCDVMVISEHIPYIPEFASEIEVTLPTSEYVPAEVNPDPTEDSMSSSDDGDDTGGHLAVIGGPFPAALSDTISLGLQTTKSTVPIPALPTNPEPEVSTPQPILSPTEPEIPTPPTIPTPPQPVLPPTEPEVSTPQPILPSTEPEIPTLPTLPTPPQPVLPSTEPEIPTPPTLPTPPQPILPPTEPEIPTPPQPILPPTEPEIPLPPTLPTPPQPILPPTLPTPPQPVLPPTEPEIPTIPTPPQPILPSTEPEIPTPPTIPTPPQPVLPPTEPEIPIPPQPILPPTEPEIPLPPTIPTPQPVLPPTKPEIPTPPLPPTIPTPPQPVLPPTESEIPTPPPLPTIPTPPQPALPPTEPPLRTSPQPVLPPTPPTIPPLPPTKPRGRTQSVRPPTRPRVPTPPGPLGSIPQPNHLSKAPRTNYLLRCETNGSILVPIGTVLPTKGTFTVREMVNKSSVEYPIVKMMKGKKISLGSCYEWLTVRKGMEFRVDLMVDKKGTVTYNMEVDGRMIAQNKSLTDISEDDYFYYVCKKTESHLTIHTNNLLKVIYRLCW